MAFAAGFALNLAAGLTETLFTAREEVLTRFTLGDAETRRLRTVWESALRANLERVTTNLNSDLIRSIWWIIFSAALRRPMVSAAGQRQLQDFVGHPYVDYTFSWLLKMTN